VAAASASASPSSSSSSTIADATASPAAGGIKRSAPSEADSNAGPKAAKIISSSAKEKAGKGKSAKKVATAALPPSRAITNFFGKKPVVKGPVPNAAPAEEVPAAKEPTAPLVEMGK
jgi:hypothetical protein